MKYLLDTHAFLWWNLENPQLSRRVREIIADGRSEVYLSAASAWEIEINTAKGRLVLPHNPDEYVSNRMEMYRFRSLPIQISHALRVHDLPDYHDDPFDRILITQSQLESIPLLTADVDVAHYDVETTW